MEGTKLHVFKYLMNKNGWSQRDIGLRAGIPEGRLSHIVTGRLQIRDEERQKICQILKIKDKELFPELYQEDE